MSIAATLTPEADFFACFGIPRSYTLDRDLLESRYLEISREVHPDRFAGGSARQQRLAVERASLVNRAYRTLRDPVQRAEYLVKLGGIDLDRSDPEGGAPDPGQGFLIEMIELRESLEEAVKAGPAELERLRMATEERQETALDAGIDALEDNDMPAAAGHLVIHRYLQRFLDEVEAALTEAST